MTTCKEIVSLGITLLVIFGEIIPQGNCGYAHSHPQQYLQRDPQRDQIAQPYPQPQPHPQPHQDPYPSQHQYPQSHHQQKYPKGTPRPRSSPFNNFMETMSDLSPIRMETKDGQVHLRMQPVFQRFPLMVNRFMHGVRNRVHKVGQNIRETMLGGSLPIQNLLRRRNQWITNKY